MTRKGSATVLLFLLLSLLPARAAHAFVSFPCTSDVLVKVLDVPALQGTVVSANEDLDEKQFNLGYLFKGCFSGQWVGHVGHATRYVVLAPGQLEQMISAAGLSEPPAAPSFWSARDNADSVFVWVAILALAAFGAAMRRMTRQKSEFQSTDWSASIEQAAMSYTGGRAPPLGHKPSGHPASEHHSLSHPPARPLRQGSFGRRPH